MELVKNPKIKWTVVKDKDGFLKFHLGVSDVCEYKIFVSVNADKFSMSYFNDQGIRTNIPARMLSLHTCKRIAEWHTAFHTQQIKETAAEMGIT